MGGAAHFGSGGGGALPKKLNPPPVGGANPGGSTITTCAVTIPFVLGVHASGFTISCPWNGVMASAKSSMFSQPGTGLAALGGWKVHGSRCACVSPHDVIVLTAQSSAAFKFGLPVTRAIHVRDLVNDPHDLRFSYITDATVILPSQLPSWSSTRSVGQASELRSAWPLCWRGAPSSSLFSVLR